LEVDEILKNPIGTATDFAKKYNVITVLKDARTVIAAPDGRVTINITGTPAMSKGGSGDCLAGIIGALVAQGVDCYNAAALGCYISGKAGELAHKNLSAYGVLATDMIDCIAKVFCV
jgi:NAD(P)H-hydrate epimerase